ncbi:Arc family DNA-binding protein [Deefgea piscis]|uniref:Arc family DNA-binding protein n=1 Tax=Deefgea piscis TaxID=2739061 RepID=UPI001C7F3F3A|nr:Arc family DNA-binding protein [Deefgea piscis]QZA80278.1 Arc family DNA-binding protein [Deefgea piscis]
MTQDYVRSQIRLPNDVHEQLIAATEKNKTSLNNEMVRRIHASLNDETQLAPRLARIEAQNQELLELISQLNQQLAAVTSKNIS